MFYYLAHAKSVPGPGGEMSKAPDIPQGYEWAGLLANIVTAGFLPGTGVYGICTTTQIPVAQFTPGMIEVTQASFKTWHGRTADPSISDRWLGQ